MKKSIDKFIYWAPRVFSILYIFFLALFSLDIFEFESGFVNIIIGLFMHNIPVFILIIILILSWKREIIGAVAFIIFGLLYTVSILMRQPIENYHIIWILSIAGPSIITGILFLISWIKNKKTMRKNK